MTRPPRPARRAIPLAVLALAAVLASAPDPVRAQDRPSAADIVRALKPPPLTRSWKPVSRGITVEGPAVPEAPPSIDLQVNFEYDTSNLTNDAIITLKALGEALRTEDLAGLQFRIVGHTDGRGSDAYNLELSRRRAEAVRAHLVQFHAVEGGRLATEGRGKRDLLLAANPEDGINRRVQIVTER